MKTTLYARIYTPKAKLPANGQPDHAKKVVELDQMIKEIKVDDACLLIPSDHDCGLSDLVASKIIRGINSRMQTLTVPGEHSTGALNHAIDHATADRETRAIGFVSAKFREYWTLRLYLKMQEYLDDGAAAVFVNPPSVTSYTHTGTSTAGSLFRLQSLPTDPFTQTDKVEDIPVIKYLLDRNLRVVVLNLQGTPLGEHASDFDRYNNEILANRKKAQEASAARLGTTLNEIIQKIEHVDYAL